MLLTMSCRPGACMSVTHTHTLREKERGFYLFNPFALPCNGRIHANALACCVAITNMHGGRSCRSKSRGRRSRKHRGFSFFVRINCELVHRRLSNMSTSTYMQRSAAAAAAAATTSALRFDGWLSARVAAGATGALEPENFAKFRCACSRFRAISLRMSFFSASV